MGGTIYALLCKKASIGSSLIYHVLNRGNKRETVFHRNAEEDITVTEPAFAKFGSEVLQRCLVYKEFLRNFDGEEKSSFRNLEEPKAIKNLLEG